MSARKAEGLVEVCDGVWVAWSREAAASTLATDRIAVRDRPVWRQRESLAARGLLRTMLARFVPRAAAAPAAARPGGRPALVGWPELGISLSHDADVVAAAIAPGRRIGVDVQLPPARAGAATLRRCLRLGPRELSAMAPADRARELAWVWSAQEACVKADGSGIAGRPWSIDVPLDARSGRWHDLTWHSLREQSEIPVSCAFGAPN